MKCDWLWNIIFLLLQKKKKKFFIKSQYFALASSACLEKVTQNQ